MRGAANEFVSRAVAARQEQEYVTRGPGERDDNI